MSAIITDQFRILNASTFVNGFVGTASTENIFYTFIGLSNPTNIISGGNSSWNSNPPPPLDNFYEENTYRPTLLSLKKITSSDVVRVVRKVKWEAGRTYEMYRPDYSIDNKSPITDSSSLYDCDYVVINSNYRVYICLNNGTNPSNPLGQPSVDEPDFTDLDPQTAGTSGDGYLWKYLYTLSPQEIIKFDSVNYIPVPNSWGTTGESLLIKNNAVNGEVQTAVIKNAGSGYPVNTTWINVPILGDGTGGKATVVVNASGSVSRVTITNPGSKYTVAKIQFEPGAPGTQTGGPLSGLTNNGTIASIEVIITPKGGHGYDIYRELGAYRVMLFSNFSNSIDNPDFLAGNDFARIGIVKNPTTYGSQTTLQSQSVVSGVGAIKFTGAGTTTTDYLADALISQTVGVGSTAYGYVVSYDEVTGVLKYYQPIGLSTSTYGLQIHRFTSNPGTGGTTTIGGASVGTNLQIATTFTGTQTEINNRTYKLGLSFVNGIAPPEIDPISGDVIYVDNRVAIPRSATQTEDIRIVVEF